MLKKEKIPTTIGQRLRTRRKELGMSQKKLAQNLGVSFQQIQKYEKGINQIDSSKLIKISNILAVPIQYFFKDFLLLKEKSFKLSEDPSSVYQHEGISHNFIKLFSTFSQIKDLRLKKQIIELIRSIVFAGI
ncbi:MAG: helix-turn-helix domain-containing protein [Alphaproteobacteria bacterium]